MRQNAEKAPVESSESYPQLRVVDASDIDKQDSGDLRPELLVLGWEPRARRLASLRSGNAKS